MVRHIFREYDIRGVADRDLTDETVQAIGRGLGQMLAPPGRAARIVVARDCRSSSPRLFDALVQGLVTAGCDVIDVGVGPTPLLYFAVHHLDTDGGVMITGSHNPAPDNGFKIMRGKASFFGPEIQRLRELVERNAPAPDARGSVQTVRVDDAYLDKLRRSVNLQRTDLKVVVDAGNGAAGPLGIHALRSCGLDPVALYCEMDGSFPNHHPDPTVPKNLEDLIAAVRREGAVVGLAWDGDGDRLGVVDQSGEIVWGDRLLALFARDVLKAHPGAAVVGDVKCSQVLFDDVARHGGRPIMWKTGHSLIKAKVKEEQALLAGEMSGHMFFADRYPGYDDAIYAALRLIEILAAEGRTIEELLSDLPRRHATPELRLDCPDALKFQVVERTRRELTGRGALTDIDGVRITYADGAWGLVRASNTGPVLVLRFEAPTEERLLEVRAEVEAVVLAARAELERAN
ncbi:MAG TPA: phosphomannomutase/phosphoglucomutase [Polyangiaceae bacterium]|nr:phosphomannomutase/phosphoglucomutase [Polyangiaceae bacterium]